MLNFTAGTSFCAYPCAEDIEVRFIPPSLLSFFGAKQALKRSAHKALRAASVTGWVLVAGLVAYNYVNSLVSARHTQTFNASVEAQIDKDMAVAQKSHARQMAAAIKHIQTFDSAFDFKAWNSKAGQAVPQPISTSVVIEPSVMVPTPSITVSSSAVVMHTPVIDAAYVAGLIGIKHPLVTQFKLAQKNCPALVSGVSQSKACVDIMNPLYQRFADAVVAKTQVKVAALPSIASRTSHLSASATKLLKIQQPKHSLKGNRPVRVANAKPHKKKTVATRPAFDGGEFFRNMGHGSG